MKVLTALGLLAKTQNMFRIYHRSKGKKSTE